MRSVRDLHDAAMSLAVKAQQAHNSINIELERQLARQACELEEQAAVQLLPDPSDEPTRAILFCSAASLAWQAGDVAWCKRLCHDGLRGFPPPEYEADFNELLDKATLSDHLDVRGIELHQGEFQMSLVGNVAAAGIVPITELTNRIVHITSLLMQRIRLSLGKPFTDLRKRVSLADDFVTYANAWRPGSFALTIGLTRPPNKKQLLPIKGVEVDPSSIVEDVISDLGLLSNGLFDTLEKRIGDNPYLVHFMAHAKEIAPDGKRIKMVGLTRNENRISFQLPRSKIKKLTSHSIHDSEDGMQTISGLLTQANIDNVSLGLRLEGGKLITLKVKEGLEDIVRNYFGKKVEATGVFSGKAFIMSSVDPVENDE